MVSATDRMEKIEETVHSWFLKNQDKVSPIFWWKIKNGFLPPALEEMGISNKDYQDLCDRMSKKYESMGSAE